MRTSIQDKRVIISAGAGGIGRALISELVSAGAKVATCDISEDGVVSLRREHPTLIAEVVDVANTEEHIAFLQRSLHALDGIDALINNVGISGPTGRIEDLEAEDLARVFKVNVESHFVACKIVLPHMRHQGAGSVLFISSTAGRLGFALRTPYSASKFALVGLMKSLAIECGPAGIRVNAIMPGVVDGDRIRNVIRSKANAEGIAYEDMEREWLSRVSLRRMIPPQEIAEMVHFLISDAGRNISGQSLSLCGNTETIR